MHVLRLVMAVDFRSWKVQQLVLVVLLELWLSLIKVEENSMFLQQAQLQV